VESMVFHVEYRWNGITKMAGISPKTYSIWNGWNPPGMIWIPHGFHVEYAGTVKTSNSVPIFHEDVTYILKDEIPEYTEPYIAAL